MKNLRLAAFAGAAGLLIGAVAFTTVTGSAFAGPKPPGAKAASGAEIKAAFSGKSWRWSKGGAYFASNGKFHAVWEQSVGLGSWSVSGSGTVCQNATWYWDDDGLVTKKEKECYKHVVDSKGALWQHTKEDGWYKFPKRRFSSGDKYSSKVKRIRKKLGI